MIRFRFPKDHSADPEVENLLEGSNNGYVDIGSGYGILNNIRIEEGGLAYWDSAGGSGDEEKRIDLKNT